MPNAAERAEARRVLKALIEDEDAQVPAFVPLPPPTGLALLASALEDYAGSMPPWWRGLGLLTCGIAAAYLPVSVVVLVALVLPPVVRWRAAARLRRANRRINQGKNPGGRTVRDAAIPVRARRAAALAAGVAAWLLGGFTVSHTAGYSSTAGLVFWAGSALAWAVAFVPMWNAARARRATADRPDDEPTARAVEGPVGWEDDPITISPRPAPDRPTAPPVGHRPPPRAAEPPHPPGGAPTDRPVDDHRTPTAPPVGDPGGQPTAPPDGDQTAPPVGDDPDGYRLPPLALLAAGTTPPRRATASSTPHAKVISGVLLEHNVGGRVLESIAGPTVTRHVIVLNRGVKVAAFRRLEPDLQKALAVAGPISLVDAVPGRDAVAVDVPNPVRGTVTLGGLLRAARAELAATALGIPVGFTVDGTPTVADLAKAPHAGVAGATGAGKSVYLNSLLVTLLMQFTPATLGLVLVDPKRVELTGYASLPHLIVPIATEYDEAIDVFEALLAEMDSRYQRLQEAGCRDLGAYNAKVAAGRAAGPALARIVCVVDELADLMLENDKRLKAARRTGDVVPDLEQMVVRILQLARAAGIHLVLATQRPSVDVVTGLIKANLPARMAFAVAKRADSMVLLDQAGAERLLGAGDGLWQPQGNATIRVQAAAVTDAEIEAVVAHWAAQPGPAFDLPPAPARPATAPAVAAEPVPVAPLEPPAREVVYAAAVAQAVAGRVDKRAIIAATPGMRPGTRDKALTDLAGPDDGRLERIEGAKGVYRITADATPDVDDTVSSGNGAPPWVQ